MRVFLTGGCGFIGSHTAVALLEAGHDPVLFDNFCNSQRDVADRISDITGRTITSVEGDIRETDFVRSVLIEKQIDAVIHFAGLKAVAESVSAPLNYYLNNVGGTLALLEAMQASDVRKIVFSSSATVYGEPQSLPIDESHPTRAVNPYGQTKLICENILTDVALDPRWRVSLLRYFNPVGAHSSGLIGEDPMGIPNNLMPLVMRVAIGKMEALQLYGTDYATSDGTAVRDYIHVVDLAEGHVAALEAMDKGPNFAVYNLGTGRGTSVLELISAFKESTGAEVPYNAVGRRPGDVQELYAATQKAERELGWKAKRNLADMCSDSFRFAQRNSRLGD
jgi:UDP-glucose 4-epimerase